MGPPIYTPQRNVIQIINHPKDAPKIAGNFMFTASLCQSQQSQSDPRAFKKELTIPAPTSRNPSEESRIISAVDPNSGAHSY